MSHAPVSTADGGLPLSTLRRLPARSPDALEGFLERHRPSLEARLELECRRMGDGLGGLADVLARAVGTEGRGGARWRPLFTLAATQACRGPMDRALDVAVAVELTHTASLVLDDLPCMDDSGERRGQPATHRLVGSEGAILLSVGLLSRAAELIGRQPGSGGPMCAAWGRTVGLAGMAGGQAMDVAAGPDKRGAVRRLHRRKSSALPAFALTAGGWLAGSDPGVRVGLEAFGRGIGWSHQLLDDFLDLEEDAPHEPVGSGERLLRGSRRILRSAVRRLDRTDGLSPSGRETLAGLAARVVPVDRAPAAGAEECPGTC